MMHLLLPIAALITPRSLFSPILIAEASIFAAAVLRYSTLVSFP